MNITPERVEMVCMFHLDNFTGPEISKITGVPVGSLYKMTSNPAFIRRVRVYAPRSYREIKELRKTIGACAV